MTPKDKAKEILNKIYNAASDIEFEAGDSSGYTSIDFDSARECALICVQEIINAFNETEGQNESLYEQEEFWIKVKVEIGIL